MPDDRIDVDPRILVGVPVLKGTRFPASRILAELAENRRIEDIADDHDLDIEAIRAMLHGLAARMDMARK